MWFLFLLCIDWSFCSSFLSSPQGLARRFVPGGEAVLVVDANAGAVLHQEHATVRLHPASLTKMMTAYLAFDALAEGRMAVDEKLKVSARAAHQGGTVLGLDAGATLTAGEALRAMIVRSANDAAVVVAEHLAGSESAFAQHMTARARALGMTATTFVNVTGMTDEGHLTTARDMAVLALALKRDHGLFFQLFGTTSVTRKGKSLPTVNGFLVSYPGADGIKTGFTCAAGYNLVASARRQGHHLIAVVMGANSKAQRLQRMRQLLDRAFAGLARKDGGGESKAGVNVTALVNSDALSSSRRAEVCPGGIPPTAGTVTANSRLPQRSLSGWALDVGLFKRPSEAYAHATREAQRLAGQLKGGVPATVLKAGDGRVS
ncbi:MAG: putative peptidase S11 D-alanyl-D-alanine carboxypeptidase 1 [Rhodospirillaceae bacterium]|nr:MAG: putative peptidase S11 D-alanyl-D-alanine carboxypeptidase 1 [Rhodospirillaceae bacterium]